MWPAVCCAAAAYASLGGFVAAYYFLPLPVAIVALVLFALASAAMAFFVLVELGKDGADGLFAGVPWPYIRAILESMPISLVMLNYILFGVGVYALIGAHDDGAFSTMTRTWADPFVLAVDNTVGTGIGSVLPASIGAKLFTAILQYGCGFGLLVIIMPLMMSKFTRALSRPAPPRYTR